MGIDGSTSPKLCAAMVSANSSKHRPRNSLAKNTMQNVWVENYWLGKKDRVLPPTGSTLNLNELNELKGYHCTHPPTYGHI